MGPRTDRSLTGLSGKLRRQTGALLVDNFFRGISRAGKLHPHAQPHRHDVEVLEDVPYRDTGLGEHRLDVYRPAGIRRGELSQAPVVLYVHGGGFRILSKETHWIMGLAYARRGYLVFNISYRLAPRHPFPAAVEDAGAALAWVRDNAARYGGDPERLVLAGESAGANLVTSLSLVTSYRRPEPWARELFDSGISPKAVVAACGILQVFGVERFKRRWPHMKSFIEDRLHEVSDSYLGDLSRVPEETRELADPLLVLEEGRRPDRPLPAFFAPCGTKDPLMDDTRRLAAALERMGTPCEARYYPGELHAFHALVFRPNAKKCWSHTYGFLERHVGHVHAAPR